MSRKPEIVVTGLHVPNVHFWARVLVSPDRLSAAKESIIHRGAVHLGRGDVLEIETECDDEKGLALRVNAHLNGGHVDLLPSGFCLAAWNGIAGSINIYGDNQDELAAMYGPILDALLYRGRARGGAVYIDADKIDSIVVGGVTVFFERDGVKDEVEADGEQDQDAAYLASVKRQKELRTALAAERLRNMTLHRFTPGRRSA